MSDQRRGVILCGPAADAVAEALQDLDPKYLQAEHVKLDPGRMLVLCCQHSGEVIAAREATPDIAWLVVDLYLPGDNASQSCDPLLSLNMSKVDPQTAARAIDQPNLVTCYEIINPAHVTTVDGRPAADDYSNVAFTVPDGNRMVAHAINDGDMALECLHGTQRVLPSKDLWALVRLRSTEVCHACILRHP